MKILFYSIIIFSYCFGDNNFQSTTPLYLSKYSNALSFNVIPDTLRMVGIMSQFPIEIPDNPKTSGNGNFLSTLDSNYFYNTSIPRCEGFLVDRPPHNSLYFIKQFEAAGNYYKTISNDKLPYSAKIIESDSLNGYYTVSNEMEYYAQSDQHLAEFFTETLLLAKNDLETYLIDSDLLPSDIIIVVFHAGLSQDFAYPGIDPTIYDLKSAYVDQNMVGENQPAYILNDPIYNGIILPEVQNIIYYDVVEDIFGNPDYGTENLCDIQVGLTGIFCFLLGYHLGLPEMFDTSTGKPGIGYFGLMDYGSNNGRGVIPAPPSPWTRNLPDLTWSNIETLLPLDNLDTIITAYKLDSLNLIYKINISDDEYFMIENRNNWVFPNVDIDSLRRKNKIDDSTLNYWFDTIISEFPENKIQIDPSTQVITGFDHYDYGLPGSGILLWHIKEPDLHLYSQGVNTSLNGKHIKIKEADGAQDIGTKSYAFFSSDDPTIGTRWDMWFKGNDGYEFSNHGMTDNTIINHDTAPDTKTNSGAETFISIEFLSDISSEMRVHLLYDNGLEIVNILDPSINYLGNTFNEVDSTSAIFYEKEGKIFKFSNDSSMIHIDTLEYTIGKIILTYNNSIKYLDSEYCIHPLCENYARPLPSGFLLSSTDTTAALEALSLGDIDKDGLDEIITIENGDIYVKNNNGTLVNGFPVIGNFSGVPLISNILNDQCNNDKDYPEIICREDDCIVIISGCGKRLQHLSSYHKDQILGMVPFWNGKMALIDAPRMYLFDLDMSSSYWLNSYGQISGLPISIGEHFNPENNRLSTRAYNYPNPVSNGETTFRFFIDDPEIKSVKVNIYNASGYLIEDNLINDNEIIPFEFNEIFWDASGIDSGLYFAEIKSTPGKSELVRLLIIK